MLYCMFVLQLEHLEMVVKEWLVCDYDKGVGAMVR